MPRRPAKPLPGSTKRASSGGGGGLKSLLMDSMGGDVSALPDVSTSTPDLSTDGTGADLINPDTVEVKPGGYKANNWFAKSKANDLNTNLDYQRQSGMVDLNNNRANQQMLNDLSLDHLSKSGVITADQRVELEKRLNAVALTQSQAQLDQASTPENRLKAIENAKIAATKDIEVGNAKVMQDQGMLDTFLTRQDYLKNTMPQKLENTSDAAFLLREKNKDALFNAVKQNRINEGDGMDVTGDIATKQANDQTALNKAKFGSLQSASMLTPMGQASAPGSPAYNAATLQELINRGEMYKAGAGLKTEQEQKAAADAAFKQMLSAPTGNATTGINPTGLPSPKPGAQSTQTPDAGPGQLTVRNGIKGYMIDGQFYPLTQ